MADTRTPEEKRAENLKSLISSGAKNPDTLSSSSKKLLGSRGENVLQTPTGVYVIPADSVGQSQTPSVTPGEGGVGIWSKEYIQKYGTPFEQIQNKTGPFGQAQPQFKATLENITKFAPQELEHLFEGPPEEYQARWERAREVAAQENIAQRNVIMFQQSALGDMLQAGLFVSTPEGVVVSEKGKNLGYSNIYAMEDKAVWGKAFDFIISEDKVYLYPEGTRKSMSDAGFDVLSESPVIFEKDGEKYLVLQKEGRVTLNVKAIDTAHNTLKATEAMDVAQFLDLSGYDVSPGAIFTYKLEKGGGLDVSATGITPIEPRPDGWKESNPQSPWKENTPEPAWVEPKGDELTILNIPGFNKQGDIWVRNGLQIQEAGGSYSIAVPFELDSSAKFINPQGIPYNPANPTENAMFGISTPTREFFWTDYGEKAREFVSSFEPKGWKFEFDGFSVAPSDVVGFGVRIPETLLKGAASVPVVAVGVAARSHILPYSKQQEDVAAGTAMAATFGGLIYTPATATYVALSVMPANIAGEAALSAPAQKAFFPVEVLKQGTTQGVIWGGTQTAIEFGGKVATTYLSDDFEEAYGGTQNPALDFIYSIQKSATEMRTDKESHARIAVAFGMGFALGAGKVVYESGPVQGKIAQYRQVPGQIVKGGWDVAGGVGDAVAAPLNWAGDKMFGLPKEPTVQVWQPKVLPGPPPGAIWIKTTGELVTSARTTQVNPMMVGMTPRQKPPEFAPFSISPAPKQPIFEGPQTREIPQIGTGMVKFRELDIQGERQGEFAGNYVGGMVAAGGGVRFRQPQKVKDRIKPVPILRAFTETTTNTRVQEMRMEDIEFEKGRTKSELAQAAREMIKLRQGNSLRLYNPERLGVLEGLGEITMVHQRSSTRLKPPVTGTGFAIPKLPALGSNDSNRLLNPARKQRKSKTEYAPSLAGVLSGKVEGKTKRLYSGFEIRGIKKRRIRHGLF